MTFDLLSKLVSINSAYPNEKEIGEFLVKYLKNLGLTVSVQPVSAGRFNIFAQRGRDPRLLFYGHQDTTLSADLPGWRTSPFCLTRVQDRFYGLGTYDMKGGIFAFLEAVRNTSNPVKIFLTVDEENISLGAWKAVRKKPEFFQGLDLIISAEPNFGLGDDSLTVGRTGRVVCQITFKGKSAHLAKAGEGVDAIAKAGNFISDFYLKKHQLFKSSRTLSQIRKISAESVGMSVCELAVVEAEILPGPEDSLSDIIKTLKDFSKSEVILKSRKTPYLSGYEFKQIPRREKIDNIIKKRLHRSGRLVYRSSVADDNVLATLGHPVITWGPSGGSAHTVNEFVDINSLKNFINMYSDLIKLF